MIHRLAAALFLCLPSLAGEALHSLNGDWRFHALDLEGSDYRSIVPGENDVIVDNSDAKHVTLQGKWNKRTEDRHEIPFIGGDFLQRWFAESDMETFVRFEAAVPKDGYHEFFVRYPYGAMLHARYEVEHAGGVEVIHLNQRVRCGHWISIGTYETEVGKSSIKVTADSAGDVVADAVMFRPVPRDLVRRASQARAEVVLPEFDDGEWARLKVPGHWGMLNDYSNYTGRAWYRREFELPEQLVPGDDERLRLRFDGVYHLSRVYLNGEFLGENRGGFTAFEFDVTDRVLKGGTNLLAVEADNNFLVGATWNWGGIIRDVTLVKSNEVRIAHQYLHADPDLEKGHADLLVKVRVRNDSDRDRELNLSSTFGTSDEEVGSVGQTLRVAANSETEVTMKSRLEAKDVKLWHFDHPHLYVIETELREGDEMLHVNGDRFGIRKVEITPDGMVFNGEPVRLSGYNRVSDHRYWGSSEPQELIDRDVHLMKDANANFMRIMHGAQNKRLLERCDEEGILIFEEVNVRELANPEMTAPDYPLAKQWIRGMVERDINHPCIIGWSVGNELKEHFDYVKTTTEFVRTELDPHRLVVCVSNTGARDDATPETDPIGFGDLVMQNCYEPTPERMADSIRSKWPDLPIFFSEFSTGRFDSPSLDLEMAALDAWNACIRGQRLFVIGAAPWTYNDYRSPYVRTLEDENRCWGLVDVWRQKRRFFEQAQREYSPIRKLEIKDLDPKKNAAGVRLLVRGRDDFPSYTLKAYRLVWSFHDGDGKSLHEGSTQLPSIEPADREWKGRIEWPVLRSPAVEFRLKVVTPNGYTRFSETRSFTVPEPPLITGILAANRSVRVFFTKPFGAKECFVRLHDGSGEIVRSGKTIDTFVDVVGLSNLKGYEVEVIAINGAGESRPSPKQAFRCSEKSLPPVIKHASIRDGHLVLGYTGELGDESYTVRFGTETDSLDTELTRPNRGMLVIPLEDDSACAVQIKRLGVEGESLWSNVVTVARGQQASAREIIDCGD